MSSWVRSVIGGVAVAAFVGFGPAAPRVEAAPVLVAEYVETNLGGGLFQYDYILRNQADTILDAGFDVYDFFLSFSPLTTLTSWAVPTDWSLIGGAGFLDTFSLVPGAYPAGADIGPGQSLGTFTFVFDGQVGDASFQALFVNPLDDQNPVVFDGVTTSAVPEPGSLILLGTSLAGWALIRRGRSRGVRRHGSSPEPDSGPLR